MREQSWDSNMTFHVDFNMSFNLDFNTNLNMDSHTVFECGFDVVPKAASISLQIWL